MKRPRGVLVLTVGAVRAALLCVACIGIDVVGAGMVILVFSLAGSAVFAVLFLLVGLGFMAGQAWSWMLALLRKYFVFAVVGAVCGIIAGFFSIVGIPLGIIALVLLLISKEEFIPGGSSEYNF